MSERLCLECWEPLPEQKTGRPRTRHPNCKERNKKREQRAAERAARELASKPGTKAQKKVEAVHTDPRLDRIRNDIVVEREQLLEEVCAIVAGGPIPAHLQGETMRVYTVRGQRVERRVSLLFALADDCIAELVAEYKNPLKITGKAIVDRVRARLIDAQRLKKEGSLAEFVRERGTDPFEADSSRRTKVKEQRRRWSFGTDSGIIDDPRAGHDAAGGGVEHPEDQDGESSASRAALAKMNVTGRSWSDPVGNEATGRADKAIKRARRELERSAVFSRQQRQRIMERLAGPEALVYVQAHLSRQEPEKLHRLFGFRFSILRWVPWSRWGGGSPFDKTCRFMAGLGYSPDQVLELAYSAFEKMGELEGSPRA